LILPESNATTETKTLQTPAPTVPVEPARMHFAETGSHGTPTEERKIVMTQESQQHVMWIAQTLSAETALQIQQPGRSAMSLDSLVPQTRHVIQQPAYAKAAEGQFAGTA